jgi:uncharacterized protein (DUF697 family)
MAALRPGVVFALVRELRKTAKETRPLQVSGMLAEQLARELREGGDASFVRIGGDPAHASVLVIVLAGAPGPEEERMLRAADRARTPIIAVQTGREADLDIPYVLATDVVHCPPGAGFPVDEIAAAVAVRLGEAGTGLAAKLPVLREPVCRALITAFARRNGILAAAIFVPGADFPVLTTNQLRLVLRIASAHGEEIDAQRAPEIGATIANGLAFRTLAHQAVGLIPVAGWALQGAFAYTGTRAIGEGAMRWFGSRSSTE